MSFDQTQHPPKPLLFSKTFMKQRLQVPRERMERKYIALEKWTEKVEGVH